MANFFPFPLTLDLTPENKSRPPQNRRQGVLSITYNTTPSLASPASAQGTHLRLRQHLRTYSRAPVISHVSQRNVRVGQPSPHSPAPGEYGTPKLLCTLMGFWGVGGIAFRQY